jgi:glycosyltransferase involved in cell wall biosynthesis
MARPFWGSERINFLDNIFLSIIIPAYNEEKRLPGTLDQIDRFLQQQVFLAEVLVVENGSQDRTFEIAQAFSQQHPAFRAIHVDRRGKGLAIQCGMLEAHGAYRFMCDADLSMPAGEISRFVPPQLEAFDVAIASREAPGAVRYNEPAFRHVGGRLVNTMIRRLALPELHDTQCGFKSFRAAVAEDLFNHQTMPGWSFDVEVLYVACKRNYRVIEVPIPWYYSSESKVNPVKDTIQMTRDILRIRKNEKEGMYR